MSVIICYDVSNNRLRYALAKYLERFGNRVQESVFVAELGTTQIFQMKESIKKLLEKEPKASSIFLRIENSIINDDLANVMPSRVTII